MEKPPHGIGWTPDRFALEIWYPNCGITGHPIRVPGVYTWEQATEIARRGMEEAGDPALRISFVTVDPLGEQREGSGVST